MRRLNFGCGSIQPEGWTNLDADRSFGAIYGTLKQFDDSSFDIAVAHCALQTNETYELPEVLVELHRVLRPGGTLRISLPDIEAGFHAYTGGMIEWFPNSEPDLDDRFSNWLTWYSTTRTLLTPGALLRRLIEAGFRKAGQVNYGETHCEDKAIADLDTRERECFFVEAVR